MNKFISALASAVIVGVAIFSQAVIADDNEDALARCMSAVTQGPELKGIKFHGITFNCKHWEISKRGLTTKVKGQLSHHLIWRPDDQVNYEFTINQLGRIVGKTITIERGGIPSLIPDSLQSSIEDIIDEFTDGQSSEIYDALTDLISTNRGWEAKASAIVAQIGIEAMRRHNSPLTIDRRMFKKVRSKSLR